MSLIVANILKYRITKLSPVSMIYGTCTIPDHVHSSASFCSIPPPISNSPSSTSAICFRFCFIIHARTGNLCPLPRIWLECMHKGAMYRNFLVHIEDLNLCTRSPLRRSKVSDGLPHVLEFHHWFRATSGR